VRPGHDGPRISTDFQGNSKPFQRIPSFFQGNSKLFPNFSLAVLWDFKGLGRENRNRRRPQGAPASGVAAKPRSPGGGGLGHDAKLLSGARAPVMGKQNGDDTMDCVFPKGLVARREAAALNYGHTPVFPFFENVFASVERLLRWLGWSPPLG
jgi:hypothetical protein